MRKISPVLAIPVAIALFSGGHPAAAQESTTGDAATASKVTERLAELAGKFRFSPESTEAPASGESVEFKALKEPLLSYTNPVRARGQVGSIFLWTRDARPAVIASLWTFRVREGETRLSIELHSLARERLRSTIPGIAEARRTLPEWTPPEASVAWKSMPDAELPSSSAAILRSRTRRHVERFDAEVIDPDTSAARPLRRLPKPIYEYENDGVAYGAVFAFVMATDPELLLCVEATKQDDGVQLHYAAARMTGRELTLKLDGQQVWQADRAKVWTGSQAYYFCPNVAPFD